MFGIDTTKLNAFKQGQLITGKGTGTSDDIKMSAPKGSYILPADTTAHLGLNGIHDFIRGLEPQEHIPRTENININVSNGEYILPPHAVNQIGTDTLDDIRQATHDFRDKNTDMNFADGGKIGGIKRRYTEKDGSPLKRHFDTGGMTGISYEEDQRRKREAELRQMGQSFGVKNNAPLTSAANIANAVTNQPTALTALAGNPFSQNTFPSHPDSVPNVTTKPSDKQVSTMPEINALSGKDVFGNTASPNASVVPFGTKVETINLPDIKPPSPTELAIRQMQSTAQQGIKPEGYQIPTAPTRGYDDRVARENLTKQLSTVQPGARGITAAQMRGLQELSQGDDNIRQNTYNQQMNMTQAQMKEAGENARQTFAQQMAMGKAMLDEAGQSERQQAQLGFDAAKAREVMGLDREKLAQQGVIDLYNADTSRMNADTAQVAASKKGQLTDKQFNERLADYQNKDTTIDSASGLVQSMLNNNKGLQGATGGWFDAYVPNFSKDTKKFESDRNALLSQTYLANSDLLKGVLTDKDAAELKNAFGNLQDKTIAESDYQKNLQAVAGLMAKMKENNKVRYADVVPKDASPTTPITGNQDEHPAAKYFQ